MRKLAALQGCAFALLLVAACVLLVAGCGASGAHSTSPEGKPKDASARRPHHRGMDPRGRQFFDLGKEICHVDHLNELAHEFGVERNSVAVAHALASEEYNRTVDEEIGFEEGCLRALTRAER